MRLKYIFLIFVFLLAVLVALIICLWKYEDAGWIFFVLEGWTLLLFGYLYYFYQRVIKPLYTLGNGMDLLNEQDFSSRLGYVGQKDTDRIVSVFNRMMDQLKNERLRLLEQNHFLDLLINASPMGVVILDLEGKIHSLNQAALRLLDINENELKGQNFQGADNMLISEMRKIPLDSTLTVRLGDANIYRCSHYSFLDRGFKREFYLIEEMTREVFMVERKAYEKVIRMISHEVNNTTGGIISTLDTLESTFSGMEDMNDVCEVLQVSIERCLRMSKFITNFADVVRIPEPQLKPESLNSVILSNRPFMENICTGRNISINIYTDETMPDVMLDRVLFEQVLINIVKNSAESIGENGNITLRTSSQPLSLEITDDGKGIDKETATKLFTPFFSTKPNGQGIGLIFIREVLQAHGCSFSLRTYADGMTRFRIMF